MTIRITKRRFVFATVFVLGLVFTGLECYVLSPVPREFAVWIAESVGADGWLASLAGDSDKDVRAAAGEALVRRGPRAVPALVRRLGGSDHEAATVAAYNLGRIGPPARDALPELKRQLRMEGVRQTRVLVDALEQIAGDDPEMIAEYVHLLETGDAASRALAAQVLSRRGDYASRVVPALARALQDPDSQVRQGSAEALEQIGPRAKHAIPALIEATRDSERGVRKEAVEALEQIVSGLEDADAALRDKARTALTRAKVQEEANRDRSKP